MKAQIDAARRLLEAVEGQDDAEVSRAIDALMCARRAHAHRNLPLYSDLRLALAKRDAAGGERALKKILANGALLHRVRASFLERHGQDVGALEFFARIEKTTVAPPTKTEGA